MKRDKRLHPLSLDHQHGLAFAYHMKVGLANQPKSSIDRWVSALKHFWQGELWQHFRDEENILFPAAVQKA